MCVKEFGFDRGRGIGRVVNGKEIDQVIKFIIKLIVGGMIENSVNGGMEKRKQFFVIKLCEKNGLIYVK